VGRKALLKVVEMIQILALHQHQVPRPHRAAAHDKRQEPAGDRRVLNGAEIRAKCAPIFWTAPLILRESRGALPTNANACPRPLRARGVALGVGGRGASSCPTLSLLYTVSTARSPHPRGGHRRKSSVAVERTVGLCCPWSTRACARLGSKGCSWLAMARLGGGAWGMAKAHVLADGRALGALGSRVRW